MLTPIKLNQVPNVTYDSDGLNGETVSKMGEMKSRENATGSSVGLTGDELAEWVKSLQLKGAEPKQLDVARQKLDLEAFIEGTVNTDRLKSYQDDELTFLCKSVICKAKEVYEKLENIAAEVGEEMTRHRSLMKTYRVDFTDRDIESLSPSGKILQIK